MMKPSVSVSLEWGLQQPSRIIEKLPPDEKYRTCCNCCHIRTGTVFLGLVELCAVAFLFFSIVKQLMWKHDDKTLCGDGLLRDCLIFNFSHFNITLASDYIVALLMISIMLSVCILLLFYGIAAVSPGFLFPHIIVQAFGLLFSLGYFFLYAWSYFYGDLYTQKHSFELEALVERMWLASILLIFSAFQSYLFVTVIKCTLFLQMLSKEHKRKKNQFEEVSQRVRLAKENGLWRNTSWGGGFQQYRGQYDDEENAENIVAAGNAIGGDKKKERKKDKSVNRVQWDLQKNEEKSISCNPDESSKSVEDGKIIIRKDFPIIELSKEPKKSAIKNTSPKQLKEQKSNSSNSADSAREKSPKKSQHPSHPSTSASGATVSSPPRKATGSSSPTRLHKTDSGGAKKHPPGDLATTSSSSPTSKRRRHKDSSQQQQGQESPKSSHRPRREHQHHHRSSGNGTTAADDALTTMTAPSTTTGRNSPTKLTAMPQLSTSQSSTGGGGGPIVKKISISSTPTFQQIISS